MSQSTTQHRCESPKAVRCAVITVSDTRTLETDRGGQLIVELLTAAGHSVLVTGRVSDFYTLSSGENVARACTPMWVNGGLQLKA